MDLPYPALQNDTFFARLLAFQPIHARNLDVYAYQLAVEDLGGENGVTTDTFLELSEQLLECYTSIQKGSWDQVIPTLIKVSPEMLLDPHLPDMPKGRYILDFDYDGQARPGFLWHLQQLIAKGYRLAVSGFDPVKDSEDPILSIVHIVRVDVGAMNDAQMIQAAWQLRHHGLDAMAFNLQSQAQFRACLENGFQLFHGDCLGKPTEITGRKITNNKVVLLHLLNELQKPDVSVSNLESIAMKDPRLTYRILRVANSASHGLHRDIETLSQAITRLGIDQLRRWVILFLVDRENNKPLELTRIMLTRGRMCEILAELLKRDKPLGHFMVGLLSQLDVLTDIHMPELMDQVPLNDEVRGALLQRTGSFGELLSEVERYEAGQFEALKELLPRHYYEVAYRHSVSWAHQILDVMENPK